MFLLPDNPEYGAFTHKIPEQSQIGKEGNKSAGSLQVGESV